MNIIERLQKPEPLVIDGAMGTLLFRAVPEHKGPLELLNINNADTIENIHRLYIEAGAEIIETNTFGGSRIKLEEFGYGERCEEINRAGAEAAKRAAQGGKVHVAGSIGPTGRLIEPVGETRSEEIYDSFRQQVRGLVRGGVDLIIIETMNDVQEARLALLAARDECSLPVICSMTFEKNGRTINGTDMFTGLATLAQTGAAVVGANCSMGPDGLFEIYSEYIDRLKNIGTPLSVWSNAGMPEVIDGRAVYSLSPDEFAKKSEKFIDLGISVIGGCCGTTPEHISMLGKAVRKRNTGATGTGKKYHFLTSRTGSLDLQSHPAPLLIGERLNPTARKKFSAELKEGKQAFLREESQKQVREGADILDINVGVPAIDEVAAMRRSVLLLSGLVNAPLMIDSDNREVIEQALLAYPGTPVLNSINGKESSMESLIPLIKRFGCFAVALCLDETGIHRQAEKRIKVGDRLLSALEKEGIDPDRIFIDPLILAESAEPGSAMETLRVIEHYSRKGIKTSIGLSNISFGLPQRKYINNMFLTMAVESGLTAAIVNPSVAQIVESPGIEENLAGDFLTGRDPGAAAYISHFSSEANTGKETAPKGAPGQEREDVLSGIYRTVVEGNPDRISDLVTAALNDHAPNEIMDNGLIRGLNRVGELYSSGEYFLPQMISSANTMKKGFATLKPAISSSSSEKAGRVVICTVKGDVHDIGKNIVALMLENHGFEVIDLGKDVPKEKILSTLRETDPDILCLSSLLTTTMREMEGISSTIRDEGLRAKLLIGGAVITEEYAEKIGAAYGKDAVAGVAMAKKLLGT